MTAKNAGLGSWFWLTSALLAAAMIFDPNAFRDTVHGAFEIHGQLVILTALNVVAVLLYALYALWVVSVVGGLVYLALRWPGREERGGEQ